jgi:hypothetical protein
MQSVFTRGSTLNYENLKIGVPSGSECKHLDELGFYGLNGLPSALQSVHQAHTKPEIQVDRYG